MKKIPCEAATCIIYRYIFLLTGTLLVVMSSLNIANGRYKNNNNTKIQSANVSREAIRQINAK